MRRPRPVVLDGALALALAAGAELELWLGTAADRGLLAVVAVASTLPLAARRRFPLGALVIVMAALTVLSVRRSDDFGYGTLLAMLVATYSVAAYSAQAPAIAGLLVANAAAAFNNLWAPSATDGDFVFGVILLSGPWLAGRALRAWRERAAELERLSREVARLATVEERARISRELHDAVAHNLTVTVIQAEAAEALLDEHPDRSREPLRQIQRSAREALAEMRRALGVLRQDADAPAMTPPGVADLPALVDRVRHAGLDVELRVEGHARRLAPELDLTAYRLVQEALTNTLKHAGASSAGVMLRYADRGLEVEVVDDGTTAGAANGRSGAHGVIGMHERVTKLGGELRHGARQGQGYRVHARLPFDGDSE